MNTVNILRLLTAVAMASPGLVIAQRKVEIPRYHDGETSLWFKLRMADVERIGLADLVLPSDSFRLRFWTETAVISVQHSAHETFGSITYFTERSSDSPSRKHGEPRHFHKSQSLSIAQCDSILSRFIALDIERIPVQDSIPGWTYGEDDEVFVVEVSTPAQYSFRDYWSPSTFPDIKEATALQFFADTLEKTLKLSEGLELFIRTLPKGCYRTGQITLLCTHQ